MLTNTLSLRFFAIFLSLSVAAPLSIARPRRAMRRTARRHTKAKKPKEKWNKTPELLKKVKRINAPARGQDAKCLARLRAAGIKFVMLKGATGVHTPIKLLTTKLGGIAYRRAWNNKTAPWILNCKMVENLILVGPFLRRAGIASVYWTSAWRYSFVHGTKKLSNHSYGNAMDITALDGGFGYATLVNHWSNRCGGCGRGCKNPKSKALRAFMCAFRGSKMFRTIYTPAYDALHRDHFHVDGPSPKFQLKVKVAANAFAAPKGKPGHGKKGARTRSHWSKFSARRAWEPPRSRPYRW